MSILSHLRDCDANKKTPKNLNTQRNIIISDIIIIIKAYQ